MTKPFQRTHAPAQSGEVAEPDYMVVEANERRQLQSDVHAMLAQGWVPCGGVAAVISHAGQLSFFQAMTK